MTSHSSVQLTKNTLNIMRKIKTLLLVGLAFWYAAEGFAQRGIGTNLPEKSSVLELKSDTRGLLIPRVELEATDNQNPIVGTIANSLLVYNTATAGTVGEGETGIRPGYYYWKDSASQWIPLLNTAGNNIEIDDNGVVSVKPGTNAGGVLVTVEDNVTGEMTAEWMSFEDFISVLGDNGITVLPVTDPDTGITTFTVELGGALTKDTTINTDGSKFEIQSGLNHFFISGLDQVIVEEDGRISAPVGADFEGDVFADTFDVLIVGDDGLVQRVSVEDLLKDAVAVANGLRYDPVDGLIKLGGPLIENTIIDLDVHDFTITTDGATANFQIEGLTETTSPAAANQIMVVDENNNVRTVKRVISENISATTLVTSLTDYSPYVQEVNITVPSLGSDIDLTLPAASATNEGQVINVRLTIGSESTNYLTIKDDGGADLTWGALPHQGWVIKSNGSEWLIVSAN